MEHEKMLVEKEWKTKKKIKKKKYEESGTLPNDI